MLFKASAPGSLMLLGEYGVLYGKQALVCAVNKRMSVTIEPRDDNEIVLSSVLGEYQTTVTQLDATPPFQFVLAALKKYQKYLTTGCNVKIASEFSDQMGLGSSAAVTVAMVAALSAWLNIPISKTKMVRQARQIVRSVQGLGSGADVAACVFGGIIAYRAKPFYVKKMADTYPLTVIYSGSKTPTVTAVTQVEKQFAAHPKIYKRLLQSIDSCAHEGIQAVRHKNWAGLGRIMSVQQGLMTALGVNTVALAEIIEKMRTDSAILGAKISGSGLGDCAVGLGEMKQSVSFAEKKIQHIAAEITTEGVYCEKI